MGNQIDLNAVEVRPADIATVRLGWLRMWPVHLVQRLVFPLIVFAVVLMFEWWGLDRDLIFLTAMLLFAGGAVQVFVNRWAHAEWRRQALTDAPWPAYDWLLDDQGIRRKAEGYDEFVAWEAVAAVFEEGERWIFAVSPTFLIPLPKRSLTPEQHEKVRALAHRVREGGRLRGIRGRK